MENSGKRSFFALALAVSFLVGGLTGGVAGALAGGFGEALVDRLLPSFSNSSNDPSTTDKIYQEGTLTVNEESATVDVVEKVSPAVVSVVITKDLPKIVDPFFGFVDPSAPTEETEVGGGTGFIISSDGLILTNKHVVSDSDANYTVLLNDGRKFEATVVDRDPTNDLAFIRIQAKDLPVVELGDSDALKPGQRVIAIGNSLSKFQNTITEGIVSGLGRTITAGNDYGQNETIEDVIQTDAAINPGNSGGPLLNLAGQVVGVNTAVSREGQLIGFAIPVNAAKSAISSVKEKGKIVRPFLGIRYVEVTKAIAEQRKLSVDHGALVIAGSNGASGVEQGSAAERAGVKEEDVVIAINGRPIDKNHSLAREIQRYQVGETITLKIVRDGKEMELRATLQEYGVSAT